MENRPLVAVVVDDDACVLRLVRRALGADGWEVHEATEGRRGIETILSVKPDLVILDVRLPFVQGFDVCRCVRQSPELKALKILMISGQVTEFDRNYALRCGADETMLKPFDGKEIAGRALELMVREN